MCSIKPDQNGSKNYEKKYDYCLTSLRKTKMIFLLLQNSLSIYSVSKSAGTEFFEITTLNSQKNLQWNKRNHKMITPTSGTALSVGLSVVIFFSSFLTALSLFCFRWLSMFCCLTWVTMNFGIWRREAHWESEIWYPHYTAHHPPGKKKINLDAFVIWLLCTGLGTRCWRRHKFGRIHQASGLFFDPHRPQKILVSNQQPDDVGRAGRHWKLLLLRDLGAEPLEHEDVGCHDNGDIVEGHFVVGLMVNHTLEELHQSLGGKQNSTKVHDKLRWTTFFK